MKVSFARGKPSQANGLLGRRGWGHLRLGPLVVRWWPSSRWGCGEFYNQPTLNAGRISLTLVVRSGPTQERGEPK